MATYAGAADAELIDLLALTQKHEKFDGNFNVLLPQRNWMVMDELLPQERQPVAGGTSYQYRVQYRESGLGQAVRPAQERETGIVDVTTKADVPWRYYVGQYSMIRAEVLQNRSLEKLVDLVKSRRIAAKMDIAVNFEDRFWQAPSSSTDELQPFGVPYWIVPVTAAQVTLQEADDTVERHRGGNHTSFSSGPGGIDASASAFSRWRNYNDTWSNSTGAMTEDDVTILGKMFRHLDWQAPKFVSEIDQPKFKKLRLCACETILQGAERRARMQNDSIGADLGKYQGATVYKGHPFRWVEYLDADTTFPLYMLNLDYWDIPILEDEYFREGTPMNDKKQPDVYTTFIDTGFAFVCRNRQLAGGVITYVAAG